MTEFNLDKVLHDKLQGLNCDYKPEFWNEMERKLNVSPLSDGSIGTSAAGGTSSAYIISAIAIITITVGAIAYFIFNNDNTSEQISQTAQMENIVAQQNTIDNNIINNSSNINSSEINAAHIDTKDDISNKTFNNINKEIKVHHANTKKVELKPKLVEKFNNKNLATSNNDSAKSNNSNINSKSQCKEIDVKDIEVDILDEKEITVDIEEDAIEMHNTYKEGDIKYEREARKKIIEKEKIGKEKKDKSKLKKVKPMPKPVKKVFRKKRGLLYRLGLRR